MSTFAQPAPYTLGNTAKSLRAHDSKGEFRRENGGYLKAKSIRYDLQRQAAGLLWDEASGKRQPFRVAHCQRSMNGNGVQVWRATDGTRGRFAGLTTCGSGWTCPVCAPRIAEVRRAELSRALVQHVQGGGQVQLMTLTFPHEADWPLGDLLKRFDRARNRFTNSRAFKKILGNEGSASCIGRVTSLEVTHGVNGWHPHLHVLLFLGRDLSTHETDTLKKMWVNHLFKVGLGEAAKLTDMMAHALDLRGGEDAAAYIVKYGREEDWGITSEVSRNASKQAVGEHMTPFGLLAQSMQGDSRAGALFREFAYAFLGKRLLTWTPGLRKRFDLAEDESDEAAAAEALPSEEYVGWLRPEQWRIILERNARAELLSYAAHYCLKGGQADLDDFVEWIKERPRIARGWYWQPMQGRRFI